MGELWCVDEGVDFADVMDAELDPSPSGRRRPGMGSASVGDGTTSVDDRAGLASSAEDDPTAAATDVVAVLGFFPNNFHSERFFFRLRSVVHVPTVTPPV